MLFTKCLTLNLSDLRKSNEIYFYSVLIDLDENLGVHFL